MEVLERTVAGLVVRDHEVPQSGWVAFARPP